MGTPDPSFSTLAEMLYHRATQSSGSDGLTVSGRTYTWLWLWETSRYFGSGLTDAGIKKGDRILLMVPNSASFFISFYGSILCGAIPVPVFSNSDTERCEQIMKLCGSKNIIIPGDIQNERNSKFDTWSRDKNFRIHRVTENPGVTLNNALPVIQGGDIAYIQYTSGSTEFPKGIPLSHDNLLANIHQMSEAMLITKDDVFVSWLPVYHDMGLILNTMVPLYTGARLVLLAEGLHSIDSWLKAIEQYKGTFISAPDIAYRLCVRGIRDHSNYNLSTLRVALNASEPIHANTYHMFETAFGLKNVMISGYGLAEATVAVTMHNPSNPPVIDSNNYVSSGRPLKGIEIKIDKEFISYDGKITGEILVKSPALTKGYLNVKEGSGLFNEDGFLRTGDIGYIDNDGYLFVLGRRKNIIKQAGHTLYPDDIEQVVKNLEEVRQAAAIGIERLRDGGESLLVFAEIRKFEPPSDSICHDLVLKIVNRIYDHFGIRPGRVFLLKPKSLPQTPNGKLQHSKLKDLYLKDPATLNNMILFPGMINLP